MASEQSSGTFLKLVRETNNVGALLPNLMATVLGNLTELRELTVIRLYRLALPDEFLEAHPGPRFSITGTRQLVGCHEDPLIGTIIKPSDELSPAEAVELVRKLIEAGIGFIKGDELIANPPYSPLTDRVPAVMRVINGYAQRTGLKPMHVFNITGDIEEIRRHHDLVVKHEGTCFMASMDWIGMASLQALSRHTIVPAHGHRNGWGLFYRHPAIGIGYPAYQALLRLADADYLHVNGLGSKFAEADTSVIDSAEACLTPLLERSGQGDRAMPVFSSAQTIHQRPLPFRRRGRPTSSTSVAAALWTTPTVWQQAAAA